MRVEGPWCVLGESEFGKRGVLSDIMWAEGGEGRGSGADEPRKEVDVNTLTEEVSALFFS